MTSLNKLKAHATKIKAMILLASLFCVATFLSFYFRPYYGELIYEEWLAGYYGYADDYTYMGVRITDAIDLQKLSTRAQARGYDTTLGYDITTYYHTSNKTAQYIKTPRVTIKYVITFEENKSATFTVTAYNEGFVKIDVESKYFLNTNWIRLIFAKMFFDMGLPTISIWRFTITENWIGKLD